MLILMSDQIDQLATALAKAQGEMPKAIKNAKANYGMYANFESCKDAATPSLTKYGLSVTQPPIVTMNDGKSYLYTILLHASGQFIQSSALHSPPKQNDAQSLMSYNTYLKRMCYSAIVGVATGEDDDGDSAVKAQQNEDASLITGEEMYHLQTLLNSEEILGVITYFKVDKIYKLTYRQYKFILDDRKKKEERKKKEDSM